MRGQAPAPAPAEVMAIDSPGGRRAEGRIRARPRQLHREPRGHPLPRGGGRRCCQGSGGCWRGGGEIGWASHRPSPADKLVLQNVTLHLQGRAAAGMPGLVEHRLALPSPLRPQLRVPQPGAPRPTREPGAAFAVVSRQVSFLSCSQAKAGLGHPHRWGAPMGAKLLGRETRGRGSSPPATRSRCSSAPPKGGRVPRMPPPAPRGPGVPGWLGKALLMRALKIEWDWDLNGTLWETWKHFLIPVNESRCISDDYIAS